jgi:hypothetical protein
MFIDARYGHHDTNVPQPPAAAITVTASTSSVSAINVLHVNAITDVEYAAPPAERRAGLNERSS